MSNKVVDSTKKNSMGIGTSIATVLTWVSTSFFGVVIPPEVAVAIAGMVLMCVSEFVKE